MKNLGRVARVLALTTVALAATGGVAAAAASGTSPAVKGAVTAVNGVTASGTCGTADAVGSFTVTRTNNSTSPPTVSNWTVDVSGSTTFEEHKTTSPTFGDLCVGDTTVSAGDDSGFVMTADAVTIHPPKPAPKVHVYGTVTSVNGDTTSGTCGTAGATGNFTTSTVEGATTVVATVDVDGSTLYTEPKVSDPTFADLCVGDRAVALGPENSDGSIQATVVGIHPPKPVPKIHVYGLVTAVNGDGTSGTCGTAGGTGDFTLSTVEDSTTVVDTVDVDGSTLYTEAKVSDPTFANLCVGDRAVALGPENSDGSIQATVVGIKVPKPPKKLHVTGDVTSIDGVSTSGTCGTAGDAGTFIVTKSSGAMYTINVTAGTEFAEANVTSATFADVCVGGKTVSIGTTTDGALNAVAVAAWAPKTPKS